MSTEFTVQDFIKTVSLARPLQRRFSVPARLFGRGNRTAFGVSGKLIIVKLNNAVEIRKGVRPCRIFQGVHSAERWRRVWALQRWFLQLRKQRPGLTRQAGPILYSFVPISILINTPVLPVTRSFKLPIWTGSPRRALYFPAITPAIPYAYRDGRA